MNTRIKKIVKISWAQAGRIEGTSTPKKKEKMSLDAQTASDRGGLDAILYTGIPLQQDRRKNGK